MAAYTASVLDTGLGMMDKSQPNRRNVPRQHQNTNPNRRTGYVPVDESSTGQVDPRPKKTYAFWSLVGVVCLLAWANMILTLIIFRVLRLGGSGLASIEFVREQEVVKFTGSSNDLGRLYKPDGRLDGFLEEPVTLVGDGGSLGFSVHDSEGIARSGLSLAPNGSSVSGVTTFAVVSDQGESVFTTDEPEYRLSSGTPGIRRLDAQAVRTGRLSGFVGDKLLLRSDSFARLKGSEGTKIEAKEMIWSADQAVTLTTTNGTITLGGSRGVSLDVDSIPIVGKRRMSTPELLSMSAQYKLCVCMPQGKLFRVPVTAHYTSQIACHNIDQSRKNSPCI